MFVRGGAEHAEPLVQDQCSRWDAVFEQMSLGGPPSQVSRAVKCEASFGFKNQAT